MGEWTHRPVGRDLEAYDESTWEDASVARRRGVLKSLMGLLEAGTVALTLKPLLDPLCRRHEGNGSGTGPDAL